jgi:DNA-binding NarL/FixJ family response regulator
METIRCLVADDQRLVREGIASLLSLQEGIAVAGTAENGSEAVELCRILRPDVALRDIRMPVLDGIAAAERIVAEGSASWVVMLTPVNDEEYVLKALRAGAVGYLLKDLPVEDLVRAVRQVHRGVFQANREVMGKLLGRLSAEIPDRGDRTSDDDCFALECWRGLSPREKEVLALVGRGFTNQEISRELSLSEGTVKNYVSGILDTLGFRDRVQAALFTARNGLCSGRGP